MPESILVTGGAGFIGTRLCHSLRTAGYKVRILDNFDPQVHASRLAHAYAAEHSDIEVIEGDVRMLADVAGALRGANAVVHLAACTGVGQSMYQADRYVDVNVRGTAVLWDAIAMAEPRPKRVVIASSRAIYGEGAQFCTRCGVIEPAALASHATAWTVSCRTCGEETSPIPTPEDAVPKPISVYGSTKLEQEELSRILGVSYGVDTVALRYFNVYGAGQALSNPYTGIATTFVNRALAGKPIDVYEDGAQSRDFVHVNDVVRATVLALTATQGSGSVINVGSGQTTTVMTLATLVRDAAQSTSVIRLTGQHRAGDIRHCIADITRADTLLGYRPRVDLLHGIQELVEWARSEQRDDRSEEAMGELKERGLLGAAGGAS